MQIVGPQAGGATLDVTGQATLGGTLQVVVAGGYRPAVGTAFDVLDYGAAAGQLAAVTGTALADGDVLVPVYGPRNLSLVVTAVPEPAAAAGVLALVGLVVRRRPRAAIGRRR